MSASPVPGQDLHAFIAARRPRQERLYAIADAARDEKLALAARDRFHLPTRSLFTKATITKMDAVAPYVINMRFEAEYPYMGSGFLDMWGDKLGGSRGVLLLTEADEDAIWAHLRQNFRVSDEEGGKWYFRFYDPRVLRVYFPTCTSADAQEFFGPIQAILVESTQPRQMSVCRPGHRGVVMKDTPVAGHG